MSLIIIKEVNNMSAIVINDLTKGKGKDKILSNLNLEILDGEFFSLLGTDKSGKTTLARLLMGYLKASSGSIKLYDMDSFKESKEITYLKNNDFQIQRTYHIVMHKDKKLLPLYQEIFELIKKE
mgnify:CR=1 FL=1